MQSENLGEDRVLQVKRDYTPLSMKVWSKVISGSGRDLDATASAVANSEDGSPASASAVAKSTACEECRKKEEEKLRQ